MCKETNSEANKILDIQHLAFAYEEKKRILNDISFLVDKGDVLGVLGPNGTGKTTMIKCINNILTPCGGDVFFQGKNVGEYSAKELAKIIAYVPQYASGFFDISVVDTVLSGRIPYAGTGYSEEDREIAFAIIEKMGLEKFAFRSIKAMSGGERQRVFIARALAQQPKIIILDEPTSSLDLKNQLFILNNIAQLAVENGMTIIMTIHDLNLASMYCNKTIMLKDGYVFAYGKTKDVLTETNVEAIYGVDTVITVEDGYKHIRLKKQ